ncbi:MAG: hypothetical protein ACLRZS_02385 [Mediterraneibacter gnavus]
MVFSIQMTEEKIEDEYELRWEKKLMGIICREKEIVILKKNYGKIEKFIV